MSPRSVDPWRPGRRPPRGARASLAFALALIPLQALGQVASRASDESTDAEASFRAFLPTFEAALQTWFRTGDHSVWKELLSDEPGSTLFSPLGEIFQGVEAVDDQYDRVQARGVPGPGQHVEIEYLSIEASGELATVVALERSMARFGGVDSLRSGYTRVTHIFRREGGEWKLRHRHMDHLRPPPK